MHYNAAHRLTRKLEERIEQVKGLRSAAAGTAVVTALRKALQDRANLVVAEAAKSVAALRLAEMIPDLLTAFDRLFHDPVKNDSKCWGKSAIVKALTELDYDQSPPFVRGFRHVQMEPVWGGQEDAAPALRGLCVLSLVQCTDLRRVEIQQHLVDALADPADPVRIEAVRALAQVGGDDSSLLLRLKARIGDQRPVIVGHVFDALLGLDADRALPFVGEYLKSANPEIRDEAALALGSSRVPGSVNLLMSAWNETKDRDFAGVLLRALSSSRDPAAIEFLLNVLQTGNSRDSSCALDALKLHEATPEIWNRVDEASKARR